MLRPTCASGAEFHHPVPARVEAAIATGKLRFAHNASGNDMRYRIGSKAPVTLE